MYEDLKGKRVLVTGASSGIGADTAVMFAQQGCFVGVHYFQTENGAKDTLRKAREFSDGCCLCADVRDEAQVNEMVAEFARNAGGIDVLVNNAGTMIGRMSFAEATLDFFEDVFATNTRSVFLATRAAAPYLKESGGVIVNIGSVAGHNGGATGSGVYAAAKAAVATMTISMAKEFAKDGIRVNSVLPGFIDTRFHRQYSTEARRKAVARETPLGRNGTGVDIANAVLFLSSEAAGFITGEYIAVNGGLYMRA